MIIRKAREEDCDGILEIYNHYIRSSLATFEISELSRDIFLQRMQRIMAGFPYLVCEEDDRIMGYIYLDHFIAREAAAKTADISIYLHKDCTGRGIGAALLEEIEKEAVRRGFTALISVITDRNHGSIAWHAAHGYTEQGHIPQIAEKLGQRLGVVYYRKTLNAKMQ